MRHHICNLYLRMSQKTLGVGEGMTVGMYLVIGGDLISGNLHGARIIEIPGTHLSGALADT